jgi:hypothetical protein
MDHGWPALAAWVLDRSPDLKPIGADGFSWFADLS